MTDKIPGFSWYLPQAFKDTISQCKFEEGDVIYPKRLEEKNWREKAESFEFLIQVKSPSRSQVSGSSQLDVFNSNWKSAVIFEKIYPNNPRLNETIETTQGALYTFLWKNDASVFDQSTELYEIETNVSTKSLNEPLIEQHVLSNTTGFAMVVDHVSDLSQSKKNLVKTALGENFNLKIKKLPIKDCIIENKQDLVFSPTLGIELFLIDSLDTQEIEELIKKELYKGTKNRFNIKTHGLLIPN